VPLDIRKWCWVKEMTDWSWDRPSHCPTLLTSTLISKGLYVCVHFFLYIYMCAHVCVCVCVCVCVWGQAIKS
jgi:hypothetical protein